MSANNNDPPKNPAASSIFGQSIPLNPNAHLQSQPHSIFGPQQQVTSDARASSSPFGHSMPSNPSAHLQSQQQSVFGQNSMPFTNPTAHLQSQVQQSIFGQYSSMPSNPTADLRSQLQQSSIFGPLALQPSASTFMKQLNISYGYAQVIARAQTKVQAIAIAHAHLNAQIQAINQSHELPNHQAPPSHSHMNGGNSVNSAGHGSSNSNLVQGRCSSTQNNGQKNETVSSPSNNNEADHAGVKGNGSVTAIAKSEVDAKQSPQSDGTNISNRGKNGKGKSSNAVDDSKKRCLDLLRGPDGELPQKLRNIEPCFIEKISNEIMDVDPNVRWDDIAGLYHVKNCVNEMVILPLLRPDIFKDCRSPGRGLLLFGPPGTGKTMIGKAIAGEAKATFFYISASSITSKWMGESEKLVRALFGVAGCRQPAVIFVDEIDSLLSKRRSDYEQESSRRIKTQFLIEMEGFNSGSEQVLLIGATNRPQDLDEAARRRLTKRFYIPLPSSEARASIVRNVLSKDDLYKLSSEDIDSICKFTEGYSGSDMTNLVKDASMGPIREALRQGADITNLKKEDMRPVTLQDFEDALQEVRPSVFLNELGAYEEWNKQFGSLSLSTV